MYHVFPFWVPGNILLFLYDFKDYFNLLSHEGVLNAGLHGLLCSIGLNFCPDFGIFLDLPISSLIIDL